MYYLVKILSLLPLKLLYLFSDVIFLFVYKIVSYRKKVVRSNILKAFPEMDHQERQKIERQFYKNFCDFLVETIKTLSITKSNIKAHVEFINLDELLPIVKKHKSVLFLTSHFFNWEWSLHSAIFNFSMPIDYVYHPLHNEAADKLMLRLRGRFGAEPIKRKEAARKIIKKRGECRGFAILADQFPSGGNKIYWAPFLNIETAFFYSIEQLARLANLPVLYFHVVKVARGKYQIKMVPLTLNPKDEPEGEIIRKYAKATEKNVREQPDCYLWSHKRWKRSRE